MIQVECSTRLGASNINNADAVSSNLVRVFDSYLEPER